MEIPWSKVCFSEKEKEYVVDSLNSILMSGGKMGTKPPYIEKFESMFSKKIEVPSTIGVSNGTTALNLALLGLGVGPQDEVIVPNFTFVAPGNTVLQVGAKLVFADIDKDTWCISPKSIRECITPKTKAIIPVHIYGNVCDMDEIMEIARENNLYVVEDNAEALFSKYKERYAGTIGDVGCFSFQATKTITMAEGGAVVTKDNDLEVKMRKIYNHGMTSKRYWHDMVGYNYRLTNMQAALGCAQLEKADLIISNKKRMYRSYFDKLKDTSGIKVQKIESYVEPVMWVFAVEIDSKMFQGDRDFVMGKLKEKGIDTREGFYPFSVMPLYKAKSCPVAESISKNIIVLPSYTTISEEEINYVCSSLKSLLL